MRGSLYGQFNPVFVTPAFTLSFPLVQSIFVHFIYSSQCICCSLFSSWFFSFERREENVHFILCFSTVRLVWMWKEWLIYSERGICLWMGYFILQAVYFNQYFHCSCLRSYLPFWEGKCIWLCPCTHTGTYKWCICAHLLEGEDKIGFSWS